MNTINFEESVLPQQISTTSVILGQSSQLPIKEIARFGQSYSVLSMTNNKETEVYEIYKLLKYNNSVVLEIAYDILKACREQYKNDIIVSRTGDNEILIYRNDNGEYRNIVIDEDCDIFYFCIPIDRRLSYNEFYPFMQVNANTIASKL